ncbi:DUF1517 domain-containing protein [Sandaracinus amylolyticus]|uniref:DUF1517 domain-containing protein n=1 Tax=Sandaracinus amylolyticus TaxID=927083 RepID=UPI001F246F86|nr:DUF1517 domain-containing protein [Sandaracinus amylolyticus]
MSLRGLVLVLAFHAALATTASAQRTYRHPRPATSHRELTPEEIAEHDSEMAALQARCDAVGREQCLEEDRAQRAAHLRAVTHETIAIVGGALAVLVLFFFVRRSPRRRAASPAPPVEQWDLAVVEVALAREHVAAVRHALEEILASRLNARDVLPELATALARAPWTHVALRQYARTDAPVAEERHRAVRAEIAARETLEVPPEPGRGYRGEAAREEEEHALVSLIVLTRAELPDAIGAPPEAARRTLESLARRPSSEIVQVDLTWFPPGAGETTPTRDLVARAPRLVRT